jgi:hypothetical protein
MRKHEATKFLKAILIFPLLLGYARVLAEWRARISDRVRPDQVFDKDHQCRKTIPSAYAEFNYSNRWWPYSLQTRTGL